MPMTTPLPANQDILGEYHANHLNQYRCRARASRRKVFQLDGLWRRRGTTPRLVINQQGVENLVFPNTSPRGIFHFWGHSDDPAPGALIAAILAGKEEVASGRIQKRRGRRVDKDATSPLRFIGPTLAPRDHLSEFVCMPMARRSDEALLGYATFGRTINGDPGDAESFCYEGGDSCADEEAPYRISLDINLDHFHIIPRHRGRGYGAALAAAIVHTICSDVETIAMRAPRRRRRTTLTIGIYSDYVSKGGLALGALIEDAIRVMHDYGDFLFDEAPLFRVTDLEFDTGI